MDQKKMGDGMKNGIYFLIFISIIFSGCATAPATPEQFAPEQSAENHKIKLAVFPFQNDYYSATDSIISNYYTLGYRVVERTELYRVLEEMNIEFSGLTEYEQIKAGKILNVDYIVIGSIYAKEKNYYPTERSNYSYSGKKTELNQALDNFSNSLSNLGDAVEREQAGLYVYANVRWIDVNTGEIRFSKGDLFIRKQ